ncbi:MAG TPA: STAS domain-containing protein [Anaerolineae bacterium]|nr:STAS domain-containing protein [Anaerolineae bacterium]
MEELEISVSHEQGRVPVTVFHLKGRANLGTIERLQTKAQETVRAGARHLLLDLGEVLSLTSAGLRAIHNIHTLLRDAALEQDADARRQAEEASRPPVQKSPHLKLVNPRPEVLRVLKIAGYDKFLEIHDDWQEAVASF